MSYGQSAALRTAPAVRLRQVLLAPFGEYTRYRMWSYLQHVFIVTCALNVIAMTFEVPPRLSRILAHDPDANMLWSILYVCWYMTVRTADVLVALLPFACFFGVFWSEINHTWSRERLVIWNCGRSPAKCLAPAVLFCALFACFQLFMDVYLRPAAIAYQISHGMGDAADAFARKPTDPTWIAVGTDLVYARINFTPLELNDVTLFRLDEGGQIRVVMNARAAVPTREQGLWLFRDGTRWDAALGTEPGAVDFGQRKQPPSPEGAQQQFGEQAVDLKIESLWLANRGIHAQFLSQSVDLALADAPPGYHPTAEYRTWVHFRYARPLFAFAMGLLAAALSMLMLAYSAGVNAFVVVGITGYAMHGLFKVMQVTGEFNYISPPLAVWSTPILLLFISAGIIVYLERERFGGKAAAVADR